MNADSLETTRWSTFTIMSGARAKYYKVVFANGSLGSATTFDIKIRCPLKESNVSN